jgi:branched-chain amino acid transport system substrate-binding protein
MRKNRAKLNALVAILLTFSLFLVACSGGSKSSSESKSKVVKIGVILPLSGAVATIGEKSKIATDFAVEKINSSGGIKSLGGAKIEVVYGDSQGKPPVGVSEAERLLSDPEIVMLSGAYNSSVTLPASEVAERNNKIWFAPVPSEDTITERGFKNVFRLAEKSGMRVETQIKFLDSLKKEGNSIKTIALVYENQAFGQGVFKQWKEQLKKTDYNIVLEEAYDNNAADYTPVATKVKNANPDIVLLASLSKDAVLLTKAFVQQKVQAKAFIGTSAGYQDPEYVRNAGEAAANFYDISAWEPDVNRPYTEEINKEFVEKNGSSMTGEMVKDFVGMYVVADVLERAGSTDTEKLRNAFAETNITADGPNLMYSEKIQFDESGTFPDNSSLLVVQHQMIDGKVERVSVWPKEVARPGSEIIFPYK